MHRKTNRSDVRHRLTIYTRVDHKIDHPHTLAPKAARDFQAEAREPGPPPQLRDRLKPREG